jgi:peptidoglycan-associated lipoprotein
MRIPALASVLFFLAAMAISAIPGKAQSNTSSQPMPRELSLTYNWEHSNAPPGGCGCFNLNGGGLQLAWPFGKRGFALAADLSVVHQPNAVASGNSITLSNYLAGIQYRPDSHGSRWQPFAEILAGAGHASGSLVASGSAAGNASLSFAAIAGGGLDLGLSRRWLWRAFQADYVAGTVNNGSNNHQNILRLNTGVALRF